ncbi:MAG TPA: DUF1573 domain-containing protein [Chryseosolibacter sp.]|nr:DUF1573 domain-containing protein [Chryseosolibacter sp.]
MIVYLKRIFVVMLVAGVAFGCKDRDAEKRIAYLENKLKEMEGKNSVTKPALKTSATEATKDVKPEGPLPVIEFADLEYDFGTIAEGNVVEHTFEVKNTGEAPLIIQNAQPSCGCTVPDWTKTPIEPGKTGFVKAKFDSKGKPGMQNKTITVTSNSWPKQTVLRFKANVTPKPTGENGPVK